jgi:methionyl-tRNA formyltransferase
MSESFPNSPVKKPLRIAFFGTPEFAASCLRAIHSGPHQIIAVITSPDKKAGRGQKLRTSQVKKAAMALDLPIHQPSNLKAPDFVADFTKLHCDVAIVVAFRMLPEVIWDAPQYGSINLHASLLPQLRGAAPIQWAIRYKLTETGVTTFALQRTIDTGDILLQASVPISPSETAATLHDKLLMRGKKLLAETLENLTLGKLMPVAQEELKNSGKRLNAPKLNRTNCRIDWAQTAENVEHMIRSLNPYPTSFCSTPWGDFKVISAQFIAADRDLAAPGDAIIIKNKLLVACQDRWLELTEIVPNGKKPMKANAWINGLQPGNRDSLGNWN